MRARVGHSAAPRFEELGLDLDEKFPKPLTDDVVRYIDWELDDPEGGLPLEEVRRVRDEIAARVGTLLAELLPG